MLGIGGAARLASGMNGSLPAFDASLSYLGAGEDPFDFDLFDVLARESSPPSLASGDQVPTPCTPDPSPALLSVKDRAACTSHGIVRQQRTAHAAAMSAQTPQRAAALMTMMLACRALPPLQDSSPATSGRTGVGRLGSRDAPPCATFHNYVAQLDGMADGLCELLPPPPDLGSCPWCCAGLSISYNAHDIKLQVLPQLFVRLLD